MFQSFPVIVTWSEQMWNCQRARPSSPHTVPFSLTAPGWAAALYLRTAHSTSDPSEDWGDPLNNVGDRQPGGM
ncbi:hypothetical protein XELAEV_18030957mg [Xenopus laevis]|uniref:Uncharacterized protein n=1 Tax=Xenopus laevis TaxID=8355 RepID=A0A974CN81_XENLA|nr:hypothetical protein XELAEV_18030957mg [Xenopus laevis]